MARLIDYLLSDGKSVLSHDYDLLSGAQCLGVDNVARYYYESEQFYRLADFPNLAPPFGNFFMDFHAPRRIYSEHSRRIENRNDGIDWMGLHIFSVDRKLTLQSLIESPTPTIDMSIDSPSLTLHNDLKRWLENDELEWCLYIRPHGKMNDGSFLNVQGCWLVAVKGDGTPVVPIVDGCELIPGVGYWDTYEGRSVGGSAMAWAAPALLAISFMHCKNVTMVQQIPPAPLSKKFEKNHGRPLVRYHILNIEPMKQVLRTEGNSEKTGLKKALHICRGHFKDYRERGLFGKVKGLFWWDSHVRGTVESGIVDKDYRIKEPAQS